MDLKDLFDGTRGTSADKGSEVEGEEIIGNELAAGEEWDVGDGKVSSAVWLKVEFGEVKAGDGKVSFARCENALMTKGVKSNGVEGTESRNVCLGCLKGNICSLKETSLFTKKELVAMLYSL